jgi:hypothetical protein
MFGARRVLDEGNNIGSGDPGRAETGGDIGRGQVSGLHRNQRSDIAREIRIEGRGGFGYHQFGAHGAGEIGIGGLP